MAAGQPEPATRVNDIWLGDFNRHDPMWEPKGNERLFTSANINAADILIDALADYGMDLALPPGIPTLEHFVTKNLHRVDQVFCSQDLLSHIDQCHTMPECRPPKMDHFPIKTVLSLDMARNDEIPGFNFRKTNWQDFQEHLGNKLEALHLREPKDAADFKLMLDELTAAILETMEAHVPKANPSPYHK